MYVPVDKITNNQHRNRKRSRITVLTDNNNTNR